MLNTIILIVISYFIGSIPFGVFAGRIKGVDLTKTGSGNIGATNVFRTLGKGWGVGVFLCDLFKGSVPVWLAAACLQEPLSVMLCGAAAIAGHMFSPFMKFKGGKGVATGLGVILGIAPYLFIFCLLLGLSIIAVSGYVSAASVTCSIMLSILMFTTGKPMAYAWGVLVITALVIYKHIPNMQRLLKGTENRISWRDA